MVPVGRLSRPFFCCGRRPTRPGQSSEGHRVQTPKGKERGTARGAGCVVRCGLRAAGRAASGARRRPGVHALSSPLSGAAGRALAECGAVAARRAMVRATRRPLCKMAGLCPGGPPPTGFLPPCAVSVLLRSSPGCAARRGPAPASFARRPSLGGRQPPRKRRGSVAPLRGAAGTPAGVGCPWPSPGVAPAFSRHLSRGPQSARPREGAAGTSFRRPVPLSVPCAVGRCAPSGLALAPPAGGQGGASAAYLRPAPRRGDCAPAGALWGAAAPHAPGVGFAHRVENKRL